MTAVLDSSSHSNPFSTTPALPSPYHLWIQSLSQSRNLDWFSTFFGRSNVAEEMVHLTGVCILYCSAAFALSHPGLVC